MHELNVQLETPLKDDENYFLIMDHSITTGDHKIQLTLGVKTDHLGRALRHEDVWIADLAVGASFTHAEVKGSIQNVIDRYKKKPLFVLSDNGSNIVKGVEEAGCAHHHDIGHSVGNLLKKIYEKDPEFQELYKEIGNARTMALSKEEYLMPPKLRVLARWMNCSLWIDYCWRILHTEVELDEGMRKKLSFIWNHSALIDELHDVIGCINDMFELMKTKGLSYENIITVAKDMQEKMCTRGGRPEMLAALIANYLEKEMALLENENDVHYISSDIIETIFSYFKAHKSPNRMFGVTSSILSLPLHLRMANKEATMSFNVTECIESIKKDDVYAWAVKNIPENAAKKRRKVLNNLEQKKVG